jgi:hypothetical protein
VTDEIDRRVLNSYLNQFYCEDALSVPNYQLSPLPHYYIPDNGPLQSFKDYIQTLPVSDRPEAFGQHANADISYMITDSNIMLDSILMLQPAQVRKFLHNVFYFKTASPALATGVITDSNIMLDSSLMLQPAQVYDMICWMAPKAPLRVAGMRVCVCVCVYACHSPPV